MQNPSFIFEHSLNTGEKYSCDHLPKRNFGKLLGHSPAMQQVFSLLGRSAKTDTTVLIFGESGTGKELAAHALHEGSSRNHGKCVIFDCGAVSPTLIESQLFGHAKGAFTGATEARAGVVEAAHGGTLVLDEIGDLPLDLQPKLLRVLENRTICRLGETHDRPIDVRFVACTNCDLAQEVRSGRFREDLLYRLSVISIRLPPLRERREEISSLVRHFIGNLSGDKAVEVPEHLLDLMFDYQWPGNVRELRNFVERYLAFPTSAPEMLFGMPSYDVQQCSTSEGGSPSIGTALPFHAAKQRWVDYFEKSYLLALFKKHRGNVSAVARDAGLSRQTCYRLIIKHKLRGNSEPTHRGSKVGSMRSSPTDSHESPRNNDLTRSEGTAPCCHPANHLHK